MSSDVDGEAGTPVDPKIDPTIDPEDSHLLDAECSACLGTRVIADADTGESFACRLCAPSTCATTLEIDVPTTEVVRRSVGVELADPGGARRSMRSPMASLSRWAKEYLDAERAFRLAQARVASGAPSTSRSVDLGEALRRVALAELTLREATATGSQASDLAGLERERVDLIGAMIDRPGFGAHLVFSEVRLAVRRRAAGQAIGGASQRRSGAGWIRRALGRLRRGWEPGR